MADDNKQQEIIPTDPVNQQNVPSQFSILGKLLSGRFILTVIGGICLYTLTNTICQLLISKKEAITITELVATLSTILMLVSNIVTFYFTKQSMINNSNNNGN